MVWILCSHLTTAVLRYLPPHDSTGGGAAEDGRRLRGAHVDQRGVGRLAPVGGVGSLARRAGATTIFVVLQGGRRRCFEQQQRQHNWTREIAARLSVFLFMLGPGIHSFWLHWVWSMYLRIAAWFARKQSNIGRSFSVHHDLGATGG